VVRSIPRRLPAGRAHLAVQRPGTPAGIDAQEKIRENRARRAVARRGYRLAKTRRRDRSAYDLTWLTIIGFSSAGSR
jgi:hypothetical protein